ncbi:MAG: arylsulfatase [Betaproteobacteria bacterium]|nr:arylsulfatase [Betaproteobacteria bacterium]
MSSPRIALIHATPVAIDPIVRTFKQLWPEARTTNLLDDSLAEDLAAEGKLTDRMIERFVTLARYARDCGADAILFTCSAFGPAIETARRALTIPVLKPNEAMLEEALAAGPRIGLIATFEPSIPALVAELEETARRRNMKIEVETRAVPLALLALHDGRAEEHDRMIAAAAEEVGDCDALILGQFSMASAAEVIAPRPGRKVLTSPVSAVLQLQRMLNA